MALEKVVKEKVEFEENAGVSLLFGPGDRHLKAIERELHIKIHSRGNELTIVGAEADVELTKTLLSQLYEIIHCGFSLYPEDVVRATRVLKNSPETDLKAIFTDTVFFTSTQLPVTPKGVSQKQYIDAMRKNDIVFGIGPAGTGKTYLAMAMAVSALQDQRVRRIVLTRPAVEAGEKLGFLPGDLVEKVNPYLRPLYDALHDLMDLKRVQHLIAQGQIEVAPLAFMRGRTLNCSFVILDEAQNATSEQMLMFLTRLGYDSKAVITGDITQIDLPEGRTSGLLEAKQLLDGIDGLKFCAFTEKDVVRHPLVQKIIIAYEQRIKSR